MADRNDIQRYEEQWLQYQRLSRQNPGTNGKSVFCHYDCICIILLVVIYINENIKPIKVLKQGRRTVSLFKYALDYIA